MNKYIAWLIAVLLLVSPAWFPPLHAEYDGIRQTDVATIVNTQAITASGTYTSKAWTALPRTINQSAAVRGTGTSPNYKVEILISLDGENFVKPETGGDLGTFTDSNWHIMAISVPLSVAHKFYITELGGANTVTVTVKEASQ